VLGGGVVSGLGLHGCGHGGVDIPACDGAFLEEPFALFDGAVGHV
jgi:hypothetical protein